MERRRTIWNGDPWKNMPYGIVEFDLERYPEMAWLLERRERLQGILERKRKRKKRC